MRNFELPPPTQDAERHNLAMVRESFEVFVNERRIDLAARYFDPEFEMPSLGLRGLLGVRKWAELFFKPFPDLQDELLAMCATGDTVITWLRASATHQGEWRGIPASGKSVAWHGVAIDRVRGGRIFHRDVVIDWQPVIALLNTSTGAGDAE